MAEPHVISALRAKRAELSGDLIAAQKRLEKIRDDLDTVDRTLRVFDPRQHTEKIRPVIKRKGDRLFTYAAATHFAVSVSFVVNLMPAYRTGGSVEPKPSGGKRHAKLDPHRAFLLSRVAEQADITMPELAGCRNWPGELAAGYGTRVDPASLSRWLIRNGYRFKKTLVASECDRPDIRQAREEWSAERQPKMRLERASEGRVGARKGDVVIGGFVLTKRALLSPHRASPTMARGPFASAARRTD